MIPVTGFEGRRVAVFGLGKSGISSAKALAAGGAAPACWDDAEKARAAAAAERLDLVDLAAADWSSFAALILAPGVPLTHPAPHWAVRMAEEAMIPVLGDVELFCRERRRLAPAAPLVAVTGTNGKSTTTALIAHLLRSAGREVELGGNIGTPVLALKPPSHGTVYVLECSSYQIELAPTLDPTVGVLLNISPDHIDRHGSFARYRDIKARLAEAARTAVVGIDDGASSLIADHIQQRGGRAVRISARNAVADGVTVRNGAVLAVAGGAEVEIASLAGIPSLRGAHNGQNAAAAAAAVRALGVPAAAIPAGLRSFPGLPHRMEEVGRRGRVLFVNDSKATNADATGKALASFNDIYWIVGGRPKSDGIDGLDQFYPKVVRAFLIGEAAEAFARKMEGRLAFELAGALDAATRAAAAAAAADPSAEPVVLLSPACASFDQFDNFEHRGDTFRRLVQSLAGVAPRGVAA